MVFNNRGVSGETLLVRSVPTRVKDFILFFFFFFVRERRPCSQRQTRLFRTADLPVELLFFFCCTRVTEPTGSLSGRRTDNVAAQQGLSYRQILYFNAEPQKYELAKHVLSRHLA